MGDVRWVKFEVNMYDDTKLKILDELDRRDSVHYFWTRFLVLCGKINRGGYLYITDYMPYTVKTLAIEFNRSVEEVKYAVKVLKKLEMIEVTADKVFKIKNWEKHQNVEGLERLKKLNSDRVARHRAKKKENNENKNKDRINSDARMNNKENNEEIHNIETQAEKNVSYLNKKVIENTSNKSNVTEDDNKRNINNGCNITCNANDFDGNITVTEQNKKEIKKKKEKKIESKSEFKPNDNASLIKTSGISEAEEVSQAKSNTPSPISGNEGIKDDSEKENAKESRLTDDSKNNDMSSENAAKLLKYYENLTGRHGGINIGILKLAIDMHGYNNVKMAMDKALEVNKVNMTYINGILKNWRREGYPKDDREVKDNGVRGSGKNNSTDKNEFTGFKPKKPRNLADEERKRSEKDLL